MNTVVEQKEPELGDTDSRAESVGVLYHVSVGGEVWSVDLADVFEQRLVGATCGRKLTPQEAEQQTVLTSSPA